MNIQRIASASWEGDLESGTGAISTESGALADEPIAWSARVAGADGTNPEELLAAAVASCYAMAFTATAGRRDRTPRSTKVRACCTLDKGTDGLHITEMTVDLETGIPGMDDVGVRELAEEAALACPVSRALATRITIGTSTLAGARV